MSGFRVLDAFVVYTDLTGNLAAGGTLEFYQSGTDTPADVFGDKALTVNNGATLTIGTDGRASKSGVRADVWGDSAVSYRCIVKAADGTTIEDVPDLAAPGAGATTIPGLVAGEFLTSDGTVLSWAAIRQALDPAGAANKVLGSDGSSLVWIDKPSNGAPGDDGTNAAVDVSTSSLKVGDGTNDRYFIQTGTGSIPASGGHTASKDVLFPTAFKTIAYVKGSITSNSFASASYQVATSEINKSTTGFTLFCDTNSSDGSNGNIVSAIPFDWIAVGTIAAS